MFSFESAWHRTEKDKTKKKKKNVFTVTVKKEKEKNGPLSWDFLIF